ncbi:hypothetical protein CDCA_CDCA20G4756 [Cyanidium caldarium]|uniref:RING-type domain-containing protein n=1 Tax=Cyanidium caldarium TaxID=2771 RepID=A0AAV9J2X3_CYACA|nr:hypothetical protein CDCA_CDCA20G4756 [Cyanidium caldarium]
MSTEADIRSTLGHSGTGDHRPSRRASDASRPHRRRGSLTRATADDGDEDDDLAVDRASVERLSDTASVDCPLCLEELDTTDRSVRPCRCGYQVCLWCLNRLRLACEVGQVARCPACRTPYDEDKFEILQRLDPEVVAERERRRELERRSRERRERQRRLEDERRQHREYQLLRRLKRLRQTFVLRRNLVCVRELAPALWSERLLRRHDLFGRHGRIRRVLLVDGIGVYIEYDGEEAAARAISALNGERWQGRELRLSLATVRYCEAFVRAAEAYVQARQGPAAAATIPKTTNVSKSLDTAEGHAAAKPLELPHRVRCPNPHCLYQHELVPESLALTKEAFLESSYGPPPPPHAFAAHSIPAETGTMTTAAATRRLEQVGSPVESSLLTAMGVGRGADALGMAASVPCLSTDAEAPSAADPEYQPPRGRSRRRSGAPGHSLSPSALAHKAPGARTQPIRAPPPAAAAAAAAAATTASSLSAETTDLPLCASGPSSLHSSLGHKESRSSSIDSAEVLLVADSDPVLERTPGRVHSRAASAFGAIGQPRRPDARNGPASGGPRSSTSWSTPSPALPQQFHHGQPPPPTAVWELVDALASIGVTNVHFESETENTASSASTSNGMLVPEAPSDGGHAHWLQRLLQAPTDDPAEEQHDGTG